MRKLCVTVVLMALAAFSQVAMAQKNSTENDPKSNQYYKVKLENNLGKLSTSEQNVVSILIEASNIIDDIYWEQVCGTKNRETLMALSDPSLRDLAMVNYGPWNRLDGGKSFIPSFGKRPAGLNFYPSNISSDAFKGLSDKAKTSPYTVISKDSKGKLTVVPYNVAYAERLATLDRLLVDAVKYSNGNTFGKYLDIRRLALKTDDYSESDILWRELPKDKIDFIVGPYLRGDDEFMGLKASYGALVLVYNKEKTREMAKLMKSFSMLRDFIPSDSTRRGLSRSGINVAVAEALYFGGAFNAGVKSETLVMPGSEDVRDKNGIRIIVLKNIIEMEFKHIYRPLAEKFIDNQQMDNLSYNAVLFNKCIVEMMRGFGRSKDFKDAADLRKALKDKYETMDLVKSKICGLYALRELMLNNSIREFNETDLYVTFLTTLLQDIRCGVGNADAVSSIMCFNYLFNKGAITIVEDGRFSVNTQKMSASLDEYAHNLLTIYGNGNYAQASKEISKYGVAGKELSKAIKDMTMAEIPMSFIFIQGPDMLGLKPIDDNALQTVEPQMPTIDR